MDIEQIREYALKKEFVTECMPFDDEIPVFKVYDKIFLLMNLRPPYSINLKCDPERAIMLREEHEEIVPGYHMNKQHWNTVYLEGTIPAALFKEMIDHSYTLVLNSIPKSKRGKSGAKQ